MERDFSLDGLPPSTLERQHAEDFPLAFARVSDHVVGRYKYNQPFVRPLATDHLIHNSCNNPIAPDYVGRSQSTPHERVNYLSNPLNVCLTRSPQKWQHPRFFCGSRRRHRRCVGDTR